MKYFVVHIIVFVLHSALLAFLIFFIFLSVLSSNHPNFIGVTNKKSPTFHRLVKLINNGWLINH